MPNSLRKRVKKMAYKREITSEEAERIRNAISKTIPQKVVRLSNFDKLEVECPKCDAGYLSLMRKGGWGNEYVQFNYCSNCGQAIDWSDEK